MAIGFLLLKQVFKGSIIFVTNIQTMVKSREKDGAKFDYAST